MSAESPGGGLPPQIVIAVATPLELPAIFQTMVAHAVPEMDRVDADRGTFSRPLRLTSGVIWIEVHLTAHTVHAWAQEMTGVPVTPAIITEAEGVLRHWLDLNTDVAAVTAALETDPLIAGTVAERPGLRLTGYPSLWEATLMTVVGQQVSLAAARTFCGRLARHYGPELPAIGDAPARLLPAPEELAGITQPELYENIRLTRARGNTVVAIAAAFASGEVSDTQEPTEFLTRLRALPGIGPWTIGYLSARALALPDAFPAGDLVLRRQLDMMPERELENFAQRWAPYRSYAALHIWAARAPLLSSDASRVLIQKTSVS